MPPDAEVAEIVEAALSRGRVETCLDLGCGGGRHLDMLAARGIRAIGVDSSPTSATASRHEIVVQDLVAPLPAADSSIDFVLMWGVFVHLPPQAHVDVMAEVLRVLRAGGTFLLDILRPDDFRNALGRPMAPNYNGSPFIEGVTDFFCKESYIEAIAVSFDILEVRDLSHARRDGRVSEVSFWLGKPERLY